MQFSTCKIIVSQKWSCSLAAPQTLLKEFRAAAWDFQEKISFVFADGVQYADRMKSLGLLGGVGELPCMAMNTKDQRALPFPAHWEFNANTIKAFVSEFLAGRIPNQKVAPPKPKKTNNAEKEPSEEQVVYRKGVLEVGLLVRERVELWHSLRT